MAISFNEIPNTGRHPIFTAEFDSSNAVRGGQDQVYKALIVGQKLPEGSVTAMQPVRISAKNDAAVKFGIGSMLAEMVDFYRRVDPITELFAVAVPDDSAGVKATAAITITGEAAEPGAIFLYINGERLAVAVRSGDNAATVHASIASAVNGKAVLPAAAFASSEKTTLEAKHPGMAGNDIDVRLNYYSGEITPAGIGVGVTAFAGGVANPDVSDAVAAVAGDWMNAIICPYTDANNMHVINEYLKECWGPLVMREGWSFSAKRGTFGDLCAFGLARNSPHEVVMAAHGIPNSPWAAAASTAANAMRYGNIDPARPFQTLPLIGILPPAMKDRFSIFPESNQLLYNGISNLTVDDGGTVRIGRLITTYKTSANGAEDTAYLDLNTGMTLGYLRWDLRNYFMRKYPRHKLAGDGTHFDSGQAIMTPKLAKAECIAKFEDWIRRGLVENLRQFKDELVVERNESNPNRLDFMLPPDLVNQFIIGAVKISFYL